MQPEPSTSSPKASQPELSSDLLPHHQHGLHRNRSSTAASGTSILEEPERAAAGLHERSHATRSPSETDFIADDTLSSGSGSVNIDIDRDEDDPEVNTSNTHVKSPESGTNTSNLPQGRSPIATLPNEILTHALSHLPPADLTSAALVSKRFHALVTTPHAWRAAFARYFPGPTTAAPAAKSVQGKAESFRSDKRAFCRLSALSTWRSEYILRTRLLRSLARGRPNSASATSTPRGMSGSGTAVMMYNSQLFTTATHLSATWGSGLAKKFPRFVHGADEFGQASASDPTTGKVDNWGLGDPQGFRQFADIHGGVSMYGLGAGDVVGLRNAMDVSQAYGMVYGEGIPGGGVYYRSAEEGRGRFMLAPVGLSEPDIGIPVIDSESEAISAVWIAKTTAIPTLTDGLLGLLVGSSLGVVSAYSLGSQDLRHLRLGRGELTARWVLSPGVPIIAISVDEAYSLKRQAQNRVWAVALNALGEVFYLTKFPKRAPLPRGQKLDAPAVERLAWNTGRSVYWNLIEPSRRLARSDPYGDVEVDGSYSPRSSWVGMCLADEQVRAETREVEVFLKRQPKDFRKSCHGWDMRRKLEVDFAGDDGHFAGESFFVFRCGLEEDSSAYVKRYMRVRVPEHRTTSTVDSSIPTPEEERTPIMERGSLFGPPVPLTLPSNQAINPPARGRGLSLMSYSSVDVSPERTPTVEEWRCTEFTFNGVKGVQLTTTTMDCSTYATLTLSEDPAIGMLGSSEASSTFGSPFLAEDRPITSSDLPGQRSRFFAAGTRGGNVFIWDCRAATSKSPDIVNSVDPLRVIYTDSPEISCLAMTALQIVVGGNDGLVQAWDPLASTLEPVRTLNSRFSSRARRRLAQAQASSTGVGINLFAAGAICLDPDPSVLRGLVSLGTHLRYWSYSSVAVDQYRGSKRKLRRSPRGSNQHGSDHVVIRSSNLKSYIASERHELEQESEHRRRESARLKGRFGIGMMETEEQALAYATLLSEEALIQDEQRRSSQTNTPAMLSGRSSTPTLNRDADAIDGDIAEAIRQSLEESDSVTDSPLRDHHSAYSPGVGNSSAFDIPIRVSRKARRNSPRTNSTTGSPPTPLRSIAESSNKQEIDDLEFAIQLSLAEEQSRLASNEEFPALGIAAGKGKGKRRAAE